MRRVLAMLALIVVVALMAAPNQPIRRAVAAGPALNGGGSSFAKLEIDQWRAEVARNPFNLGVNYVSQGSSFGRQQYIAGNLDFAASDIPFTPAELQQLNGTSRKAFAYVPVSAGGLGLMYNLKDDTGAKVNNLNLTRRAACRMFTEPGMFWDDADLVAANPGLRLPHQQVRPIVRSDGSGTSYVFSEFCLTVAPDVWSAFVQLKRNDTSLDPAFFANQPVSNWPTGWGVVGSALAADGVAAAVADSTGLYAVTYNEAGFAKVLGFPNASVQNAAGAFTQPTEAAVSIALGYAQGRSDGTFILNYTGGDPAAYFPSTYSYVIAQTTGFNADKGLVLAKFLCYAVTKGQRVDLTTKLGYARLSAPLVEIAKNAIAKIPGAPPWEQCRVDAAAPPPAATTTPTTIFTATTVSGGGTTTTVVGGPGGATTVPGGNGFQPTQTSIVTDPVTGETVVVTIPTDSTDGSGECLDPLTGLPADPASCVAVDAPVGGGSVDRGSSGGPSAQAAVPNPPVNDAEVGIAGTKVLWWLVQGASVCAIGVALAGLRRRSA